MAASCLGINDANLFIGEALFAEETTPAEARSRDARESRDTRLRKLITAFDASLPLPAYRRPC